MKFLESIKAEKRVLIKDLLHERMGGLDKPRPLSRIHASSISSPDYCPRAALIMIDQGISPKGNMINTALRYTFDEGLDKQKRFNNDWLRDVMYGLWKCDNCSVNSEFGKKPQKCHQCQCELLTYEECRFQHTVNKAIGSVDAFVDTGEPLLKMVECKILKSDDFKKLKGPMAEHRIRTNMYLRLVRESNAPQHIKDMIDTSEAHIFYMMRGHGMKDEKGNISPFKEYIIQREDSSSEMYLAKAHAQTMARELNIASKEPYYPRGVCPDMFCTRAGRCSVAKVCFSGKYPQQITWCKNDGTPTHPEAVISTTANDAVALKSHTIPIPIGATD